MSLVTPPSVQKLQMALHAKAKEESPDFRFYALYDKVYRKDPVSPANNWRSFATQPR
jgi:RNA-directed DNA polymerase